MGTRTPSSWPSSVPGARFMVVDELRALGHLNFARAHVLDLLQKKERMGGVAADSLIKFQDKLRNFDNEQANFRISCDVAEGRTKARQYTDIISSMEADIHKLLDAIDVTQLIATIGITGSVFTLLEMFEVKLHRVQNISQISAGNIRSLIAQVRIPCYDVEDSKLATCADPGEGNLMGYEEKREKSRDQLNGLLSLVDNHQAKLDRQAQLETERVTAELNAAAQASAAAAAAAGAGEPPDPSEEDGDNYTPEQLVGHQYNLMNQLIKSIAEQTQESKDAREADRETNERRNSRTGRRSDEAKNYLAGCIKDTAIEIRSQVIRLQTGTDENSDVKYTYNQRNARVNAALTSHKNVQISYDKYKTEYLEKIQVGNSQGTQDDLEVFLNRVSIYLEEQKSKLREESDKNKDVKREDRNYVSGVYLEILHKDSFPKWWSKILPAIRRVEELDEDVATLQFTERLKSNLPYEDQDHLLHETKLGGVLAYLQKTYLSNSLIFKKRLEVLKTLRWPKSDSEVITNATFCLDLVTEMKGAGWISLIEKGHVIKMEENSHAGRELDDYTSKLAKFDKLSKANQLRFLKGEITLEEFDKPAGLTVIPGETGDLPAERTATTTTKEMTAAVSSTVEQTDVIYRLEFFIQQIKKIIEKRKLKISDGMSARQTKKSNYNSNNLFKVEEDDEEYQDNEDQTDDLFFAGGRRGQQSRGRSSRSRGRGGNSRGRGQRGRDRGGGQRSRGRGRSDRFQRGRGRSSYSDRGNSGRQYSRETTEGDRDGSNRGYRGGASRGRGQRGSRGRGRGGKSEPPMKICPLNCGDRHRYGSAAFCPNFLKMSILARRQLVRSMKLLSQCCLRQGAHASNQDCRAPPCRHCGGKHHSLLCKKGSDGTKNEDDLPKSSVRYTQAGADSHDGNDQPPDYEEGGNYAEEDDWEEDWCKNIPPNMFYLGKLGREENIVVIKTDTIPPPEPEPGPPSVAS